MVYFHPFGKHLQELLEKSPSPGTGHRWMFSVALSLSHHKVPAEIAFVALREECDTWRDRRVEDREILDTVRKAYNTKVSCEKDFQWPWAPPNPDLIRSILDQEEDGLNVLEGEDAFTADELLPKLFRPGELICFGERDNPEILPLETALQKAAAFPFIVPNPMSAYFGETQEGKPSKRTLANTGKRRWLIYESDTLQKEDQLKILKFLQFVTQKENAPLVLAVDTGNKSIHGWFYVEHLPASKQRALFNSFCQCGADAHLWTKSQWVRMPGGKRSEEVRQDILFFNPAPLER